MRFPTAFAGTLVLGLLAGSPVTAATVWINLGSGDWFDLLNWDAGVPTSIETTLINNGGTAVADATSIFYPGGAAETDDLLVGYRDLFTAAPETGVGHLELNDVDLNVNDDLRVGFVGTAILPGSAEGSITSTKGGNNGGDVSVAGDADVGVYGSGAGGAATGSMNLAGNLVGNGGDLSVGVTSGAGDGTGTAIVTGDVTVAKGSV